MAFTIYPLDAGERGKALTQPIRQLAEPIADLSGPVPYVQLQRLFDADYPDGRRYYWRSLHLPGLSDEVIERTIEWTRGCVDAFEELSTGRKYLNFPGFLEDRDAALRAAHGEANLDRLRALKRRLDPDNRFYLHQSITPQPA